MPPRVTKAIFWMPLNIIIKHTDIFQIHSDVVPTLIYELLLVLNDVCVKSRRKKKSEILLCRFKISGIYYL